MDLHPVDGKLLWHSSCVTPYEWAWALENCGMNRAFAAKWVNQWAPKYSTAV